MATVEDILKKATDNKHIRDGTDLQRQVLESRIPFLAKYYAMGLDEAEKTAFNEKSPIEQAAELQENKYVIKEAPAEQLVADIGIYVLRKHDKTLGQELEDAVRKRFDPGSSYDDKVAANRTINIHKATLLQLGFNWDQLLKEGKEKGFSQDTYQEHTRNIGDAYAAHSQNAHLDVMDHSDANKYLDKIGKVVGLDTSAIKGKGHGEVLKIIAAHYRAKKTDELDNFKEQFHYYLKKI